MSQELFSADWRQSSDFNDLSRGLPRWSLSLVTGRVVKGLILANLVIYLAWGGLALYRAQMRPNLEKLQVETERARLIGEAEAYLAAARYGLAIREFQELLAAFPDDEDARQGVARAEQERDLAVRYQQAVALLDAERWEEAITTLHEMMAINPGYKDVPARLALVETQRELGRLYQEAEARFEDGDWPAAIEAYGAIRRRAPDYRRSEVNARLFDSCLNRGTELLEGAGRSVPAVDEAIHLFRQALTLRPKEPRASAQRRVAELYRDGLDRYLRGEWLEATKPLGMAYDSGFTMGGDVVELLRSGHAMAGDVFSESGKYDLAIQQYQAALELMDDAPSDGARLAAEMLARQELGKRVNGKVDVEAYKALINEYRRVIGRRQ